jgi:DNA-binding XRE family transcriptional regulator
VPFASSFVAANMTALVGLKSATPKSYPRPTRARCADVITGSQIRTARSLVGWDQRRLARACKLRVETLVRAESVEGEPPITLAQARIIQGALERAGIEFQTGASTGVTLRATSAA